MTAGGQERTRNHSIKFKTAVFSFKLGAQLASLKFANLNNFETAVNLQRSSPPVLTNALLHIERHPFI